MTLLATVQMHGIQTSGNCIRNITTDHFAGVAPDEIADPRPYCEILRQWRTLHPEFAFLPRKFKIAVNGAPQDRAASRVHDIGLHAPAQRSRRDRFQVLVGGGMGRTPIIGHVMREFLPWQQLLAYLEAILRVYNRYGRRDNIYKARIKILVKAARAAEVPRARRSRVDAAARDSAPHVRRRRIRARQRSSLRRAYESLRGRGCRGRKSRRVPHLVSAEHAHSTRCRAIAR